MNYEDRIRRMVELARAHMENRGIGAAGAYYRILLKETEKLRNGLERLANGEACMWFARRAYGEKKTGEACDWYWKALQADPLAVEYRIEFIKNALMPMNALKNALIQAETATRLEPQNKDAWRILGIVHHALGNGEKSYDAHRKELELAPDDPYAKLDLATIAFDCVDYKTATALASQVLNGEARGDALHLLAMAAYRNGDFEDAIALFDRAIANGPNDPALVEWNKSLALHSIGRYREGWKAHEARFRQTTDEAMALLAKRFTKPLWKGESGPARIHLHHEMGFGDVIAMTRYIPLLMERGLSVTVELNPSMVSLIKRSFPKANVIAKAADYPGAIGIPDFDYHLPMLSLPAIFETDIDTVPWRGPYLKPDPKLVKEFGDRLEKFDRPIVGLCWSSGIRHESLWLKEYGKRKSMHFSDAAVIANPHTAFISLQVGPEADQAGDEIWRLLPKEPSWDDTAALIANLDLVITVDTSVAHIAGAMGKETWLMMHTEGSWHWMTKRLDSPWYPSVRLFRQERAHDWSNVLSEIENELRNFKQPDKVA